MILSASARPEDVLDDHLLVLEHLVVLEEAADLAQQVLRQLRDRCSR